MKYDVFISYRREGGYDTAKHLNDLLVRDGYKVSFDIDTLRSGDFDTQLLSRIEECKDFILIIDKHTFDRTLDKNFDPNKDWLRCELAHALKHNKNIIPVFLSGVTGFPEGLPADIVNVTKKNGPEYNRYYFNDFYATLKKRFLHKHTNNYKYIIIAIFVLLLLLLLPFVTNKKTTSTDVAANIIESLVDIKFYCKEPGESDGFFAKELFAKVDGYEYKIDLPSDICIDIIEQKDFDLDGIDDVLVENVQACGGNAVGNSYFFVTYQGDGFFNVSNEFGNSVWEQPTIEDWKGLPSVLIVESNTGLNREEGYVAKERYILKQGKAVRVETAKKQEISVLKEVRNSAFHNEDDPDKTITMEYDLNNDGINEIFHVKYWDRWDAVLFSLVLNGKTYDCHIGGDRVGISSMTTNGYHDIILGEDNIFKWNGVNYTNGEDQLEIL